MAGISVQGLVVARGERVLADRLSFAVAPGEVLLLRGPNGAGKTSLLMCLAGLLRTAEGSIEVGAPGTIHFLGHLSAVKPRLGVAENLRFWAAVNGGDAGAVGAALGTVGLAHA